MSNKFKLVNIRALSDMGGVAKINNVNDPDISRVAIPAGYKWRNITAPLSGIESGVHNLVVFLNSNNPVEVDWIEFE